MPHNSYLGEVPHARKIQYDTDPQARRLRFILDKLYLANSDAQGLKSDNVPPAGVVQGTFTTNIAAATVAIVAAVAAIKACLPTADPSVGV